MRDAWLTLSLLALVAVALAACGSSSSTIATPSIAGAPPHSATTPGAHTAIKRGPHTRSSARRSAGPRRKAVHSLANPRYRRALTAFAACLRRHGINLPPPNTTGRGPIFTTKGIEVAHPRFRAATASCRDNLTRASRR